MIGNPKNKRIALKRNSVAWKRLVAEVVKRDGNRCRKCNRLFPDKFLAAHHVKTVGASGDDSMENLISVCQFCHNKIHTGEIS